MNIAGIKKELFYSGFLGVFRALKEVEIINNVYVPSGYGNIENILKEITPEKDQIVLGIPGCDNLVSKRIIWNMLEKKYGREVAKTIMPETFVLSNDEHMKLFENFYEKDHIYILKKVNQRKQGLCLTKDYSEILKAKDEKYLVVQDYIKNVLLINKRKLNLRIYFLLTIKNNKIKAYLSRYGSCIYNNKEYNPDSMDFESNITSYNLNLDIYERNPQTFHQLNSFLKQNGFGEKADTLFEKINEKMRMLCEASSNKIGSKELEDNLCAQIFGCDFIVDENLEPYLLECNKGPDMSPKIYDSYDSLLNNIEEFYEKEKEDNSYSSGYKSGGGLKIQKDMLDLLKIIKIENNNNGFYEIFEKQIENIEI